MKNKDKWDHNAWQGRSRQQVETSEKLAGISMLLVFVMIIGLAIYNAFI